jgi:hypothetical protein
MLDMLAQRLSQTEHGMRVRLDDELGSLPQSRSALHCQLQTRPEDTNKCDYSDGPG